jgi:hypothetical protein
MSIRRRPSIRIRVRRCLVIDKTFRLLSRTGPEVPPDVADEPVQPFVDEPTRLLAYVERRPAPAPTPAAGRAVIVYEREPLRPWRLWAFTGGLVALTLGVVLGQTVAYQPPTRAAARADANAPADAPTVPAPLLPVSEPLGDARTRVLEVTGAATQLRIRTVDLGGTLFTVTPMDGSATARITDTGHGPRLALQPTGAAGTVGATVVLSNRVHWTLKLTGVVADQEVDLRAGGLAALSLAGGSRATVFLPKPVGSIRVAVTGPVGELTLHNPPGVPLRLRLTGGAGSAKLDGRQLRTPPPGTVLTSGKWAKSKNRYDVTTAAGASVVSVPQP